MKLKFSRFFKLCLILTCSLPIARDGLAVNPGEVVGITVWESKDFNSSERQLKILLPKIKDEQPNDTTMRYVSAFRAAFKDQGGQKFAPNIFHDRFSDLSAASFEEGKVPMAIAAFRAGQMTLKDRYFANVHTGLYQSGADVYIVPVGLEVILSEKDLAVFHGLVAKNFAALVSVGNDVVEHHKPKGVSFTREDVELRLIHEYKKAAHGIFFGICGKSQTNCIALAGATPQEMVLDEPPKKAALPRSATILNDDAVESAPQRTIASQEGADPLIVSAVQEKGDDGKTRSLAIQMQPDNVSLLPKKDNSPVAESQKVLGWMVNYARQFQ
jgi:hypothetical protein